MGNSGLMIRGNSVSHSSLRPTIVKSIKLGKSMKTEYNIDVLATVQYGYRKDLTVQYYPHNHAAISLFKLLQFNFNGLF